MTFYEIEFPLAALSVESVEQALLDVGASSITFIDGGDEPVLEPKPGEVRLWSDTRVRALFQDSTVHESLEVPLQARRGRSEELRQLRQIPPFVGLGQRCGEYLSTDGWK